MGCCVVDGGLNRVPLPDLPPPPARGRTRTLRQNYFGSPGSLFCRQMVSLSKSLTSLGRASITSVLGSAREAGLTTFSFTFDELPDLAIHSYQLRSLAPAAIEQRICSHNTRPHRVRRNAEGGGKLFLSATCSPSNGVDIRVAHLVVLQSQARVRPEIRSGKSSLVVLPKRRNAAGERNA